MTRYGYRWMWSVAGLALAGAALAAASDAETSASASRGPGRNGTAAATARYEGDVGFARTDTHSGRLTRARGVAVGVDEDGLSLSVSHAIAPRLGPAVGATFSMSIGTDGSVGLNSGRAQASGPIRRGVEVGGSAGNDRFGPHATGFARGSSDRFGTARAESNSVTTRRVVGRPYREVRRYRFR